MKLDTLKQAKNQCFTMLLLHLIILQLQNFLNKASKTSRKSSYPTIKRA